MEITCLFGHFSRKHSSNAKGKRELFYGLLQNMYVLCIIVVIITNDPVKG